MTEGRMRKWKDGRWTEDFGPAPWGWNTIHTLIETKDGSLAAATADHGLYLIFPGQGIFTVLSRERVSGRLDYRFSLRRSRGQFVDGDGQQRPGHAAPRKHHRHQPARSLAGARGFSPLPAVRMARCGLALKARVCTGFTMGVGRTLVKASALHIPMSGRSCWTRKAEPGPAPGVAVCLGGTDPGSNFRRN